LPIWSSSLTDIDDSIGLDDAISCHEFNDTPSQASSSEVIEPSTTLPASSRRCKSTGRADNRTYNQIITDLRAPTERAHALLGYWRALERVTVCPQRIGVIVAAAFFLRSLMRGRW
jgi:hypothetical protein